MFAVAKAAASTGDWSSEHNPVRRIMWSLLVEIALADEWYRVFIVERRVGLAACVCLVYLISSVSLVITAATMDNAAAIMLIPTFLAVSVSGWMNLVIFWNRLEARSKEAAVNRFQVRRLAALRALKFEY
jgi:tryptophan-rich sensory protein